MECSDPCHRMTTGVDDAVCSIVSALFLIIPILATACTSRATADIMGHMRSCCSATESHQVRADFIIYKKIRNIEQTYCTGFSQNTTLFIKIHTNKVSMLFFDFVRENPNISTIGGIVSRSSYLLISIPYDHSRHDRADHSPLRSSPPQADRCRQGNRIRYHHPRLREQGATISLRGHHCMTWKTRQRLSTPKNRPPKRRSSDIRTVFLR